MRTMLLLLIMRMMMMMSVERRTVVAGVSVAVTNLYPISIKQSKAPLK